MDESPDTDLICKYLGGDEESLEFLIKRYLKQIYGFVCHYVGNAIEAEDITQEVFVKTWKNLKKFNKEKSFKTWLFSIAKNTAIDYLRKKKVMPISDEIIDNLTEEYIFPENNLTYVVEKLSSEQQQVISMYNNDCFTFKEIAKALKEPINTIKSRYRRAIINLRKIIK